MGSGIPADVEEFIQVYIDSVEQLEVLLYLEKNNLRDFTAHAIASALYSNPDAITLRLQNLVSAGIIRAEEGEERVYHYKPDSPAIEPMVKQLTRIYQERPVAVITAILNRRSNSVQAFSDAFLFGKRKSF